MRKEANRYDPIGFAERTKDRSLDELLHEAKHLAQQFMEDQGIAALSLVISDIMANILTQVSQQTLVEKGEKVGDLH